MKKGLRSLLEGGGTAERGWPGLGAPAAAISKIKGRTKHRNVLIALTKSREKTNAKCRDVSAKKKGREVIEIQHAVAEKNNLHTLKGQKHVSSLPEPRPKMQIKQLSWRGRLFTRLRLGGRTLFTSEGKNCSV